MVNRGTTQKKSEKSEALTDLCELQERNRMQKKADKLEIESIPFIGSLLSILANPIIDFCASFDDKKLEYQIAKQELLDFKANRESRMENRDMQKDTTTLDNMLKILDHPNFPEDQKAHIQGKIAGIYEKYETKLGDAIANDQFDGKTNAILNIIGKATKIAETVAQRKDSSVELPSTHVHVPVPSIANTNSVSTPTQVPGQQYQNSEVSK
jgi:hypothetical protein